jgi:hypothetical protein
MIQLIFLLFNISTVLFAQDNFFKRAENSDFYLITSELGYDLETRYGHTILEIRDKIKKESLYLNWGMFEFDTPGFGLKFFLGKLDYWVQPSKKLYLDPTRTTYRQKINFDLDQKSFLITKIEQNLIPENRFFTYHFFYKNCATIPRDLFDEATGGAIKQHLLKEPSSLSLRGYVRDHLSTPLYASFFLDIVMNDTIDIPISRWEESFYPVKLAEYLSSFPTTDRLGTPTVPNRPLLEEKELLIPGEYYPPEPLKIHYWLGILFIILCLIPFHKVPSITLFLWSTFSGLLGTIMVVAWIFSQHEVLAHNANLWIFWPTDFLFPFIRKSPFAKTYAKLHMVSLFILTTLSVCEFISQNTSYVLIYSYPAFALFYGWMTLWKKN